LKVAATGLEHPPKTPGNQDLARQGGAESGALGAGSFAEALNLISKLPLSDTEKAEAVRRLIGSKADSSAATKR
jgi:hypothetical protein